MYSKRQNHLATYNKDTTWNTDLVYFRRAFWGLSTRVWEPLFKFQITDRLHYTDKRGVHTPAYVRGLFRSMYVNELPRVANKYTRLLGRSGLQKFVFLYFKVLRNLLSCFKYMLEILRCNVNVCELKCNVTTLP